MLNAASLLLATAAFTVACFSVYVTSLRHARIEIDVTSAVMEHSTATGPITTTSALSITLLATNEGARAGLLESVRVLPPRPNVGLWGNVQMTFAPAQFPRVLQGYESIGYQWSYTYANQTSEDPIAFENFVSNVERLTSIEVGR